MLQGSLSPQVGMGVLEPFRAESSFAAQLVHPESHRSLMVKLKTFERVGASVTKIVYRLRSTTWMAPLAGAPGRVRPDPASPHVFPVGPIKHGKVQPALGNTPVQAAPPVQMALPVTALISRSPTAGSRTTPRTVLKAPFTRNGSRNGSAEITDPVQLRNSPTHLGEQLAATLIACSTGPQSTAPGVPGPQL